jgi:hypothetical protein
MHDNWMVSVAAVCRARTGILRAEPVSQAASEHEVVREQPQGSPHRGQCERGDLPVQVTDGIRPSPVTRRAAAGGALPRLAARL